MFSKLTSSQIIFIVILFLIVLGLLTITSLLIITNQRMVAVYNSDFKKCNKLGVTVLIDDCVLRIVKGSHDQKACDLINDPFNKNKCLDTVNSHSLGHLLPCINLNIGQEKDICVKNVALNIVEPLFCDIIQASSARISCYQEIKEKLGN